MEGHIIVTGGSGFLGQHICRIASERGAQVVSISRSGKPTSLVEPVEKGIHWVAADIFHPADWSQYVGGCRAVIHCIGVLEQNVAADITHEKLIFEAAQLVGREAEKQGVPKFIFISASAGPPGTPASYIDSKRKAEAFLSTLSFDLAILRPAMIFGPEKGDVRIKRLFSVLLHVPLLRNKLRPIRPLPVQTVAQAAFCAVWNPKATGVLPVDDIEALGKG
jgi:uncharacterized protein YbjT (DUF2867 family)